MKEDIIENYKNSTWIYRICKIFYVIAFSFMLLLDRKLVFNPNIYAKISEVYFNKITAKDFIYFLGIAILGYIILTIIEIIYNKIDKKETEEKNNRKTNIGIYFIIFVMLILAWSPYILSAFPGGIYGDTGVSINQSIGLDKIDNHHPLLYTLSIKASIDLFDGDITRGMGLISIIQIIAMAGVFSYLIYWLYKRNAKPIILIITI